MTMSTNDNKFRVISDQEPEIIGGRDDLFSATSVYLDAAIERPSDDLFLQEYVGPGWRTLRSTKTEQRDDTGAIY